MGHGVRRLGSQLAALQQLTARSRPGSMRAHPDLQRLEKDAAAVTGRWEALASQIADRSVGRPRFGRRTPEFSLHPRVTKIFQSVDFVTRQVETTSCDDDCMYILVCDAGNATWSRVWSC